MHIFLAQISSSQSPAFFAAIAGCVGFVGIIASFVAYSSTAKDRSAIKDAESNLDSAESWQGAHTSSEYKLSQWFSERAIDQDSGIADVIRTCWSAWMGCRSISLTEIHVLVARRERAKASARISAGVAALLLVIGIVGTLFSVKPILKEFQFRPSTPQGVMPSSDSPSLVNVEDSTALVNTLLHSLGDAFLPSLVALAFTIIVVVCRGIYTLSLQRYTLELDRFAVGTVMPRYRPRSISDEYEDVRKSFDDLAKVMGQRDEKFDKVIKQLTKFVDSVGPTLEGLDSGIVNMSTAADRLAAKSNSIADTLTRTLGKKSPLYAAVNGFERIFESTNQKLEELSQLIQGISNQNQESRQSILASLDEISSFMNKVSGDHRADRENVSKSIAELKAVIGKIPQEIIASTRKSFDEGMSAMWKTLTEALNRHTNEAEATYLHTRSTTKEALDLISLTLANTIANINESIKTIPESVERMNDSFNRKSDIEKAAADAISTLAQEAKVSIIRKFEELFNQQKNPPTSLPTIHLRTSDLPNIDNAARTPPLPPIRHQST